MNNLLPTSPEVSTDLSNLHIRTDLIHNSVSVYFKHWNLWEVDTTQVQITESLIHFIEPDSGTIVGLKVFSDGGES